MTLPTIYTKARSAAFTCRRGRLKYHNKAGCCSFPGERNMQHECRFPVAPPQHFVHQIVGIESISWPHLPQYGAAWHPDVIV